MEEPQKRKYVYVCTFNDPNSETIGTAVFGDADVAIEMQCGVQERGKECRLVKLPVLNDAQAALKEVDLRDSNE